MKLSVHGVHLPRRPTPDLLATGRIMVPRRATNDIAGTVAVTAISVLGKRSYTNKYQKNLKPCS